MLDSSQTLGVYKVSPAVPAAASASEPSSPRTPSPTLEQEQQETYQQIGMARFITDHVTTAYLTDVFMDPDHRHFGLGKWLIACCKEIMESMTAFRRGFLMASPGAGEEFYAKSLGFWDVHEEHDKCIAMTRRGFKF